MQIAQPSEEKYGFEDTSYKAAGGFDGIQKLSPKISPLTCSRYTKMSASAFAYCAL